MKKLSFLIIIISVLSCTNSKQGKNISGSMDEFKKGTYGYDLQFLQNHLKPIELKNSDACVLISSEYQGRVMTSSSNGLKGVSYGWLNYDLIESGEVVDKINPVGGEERFWLGPEGGQFSIFFKKGDQFIFDDWQTPACIDTEPFVLKSSTNESVLFSKSIILENYSGYNFNLDVKRKISILDKKSVELELGIQLPNETQLVAYKTSNSVLNTGKHEWNKETGMLSVWLLGMFNPSPLVTIIIPYNTNSKSEYILKDDYFGKVSPDRLVVKNGFVFFKGDGKQRGKIGIPPERAMPVLGSYDESSKVLTIVKCNIPNGITDYVNSAWELQKFPFKGDAINSYNDGPVNDGSQLGPFYELETSSQALALKPNEQFTYEQATIHFEGNEGILNEICLKIFNIPLEQVKAAFK